jgi:hypothetical protein
MIKFLKNERVLLIFFTVIFLISNISYDINNKDLLIFLITTSTILSYIPQFVAQDVVIPELLKIKHLDKGIIKDFFSLIITVGTMIILVLTTIILISPENFLNTISQFQISDFSKSEKIIFAFIPSIIVIFLNPLISAITISNRKYYFYTLPNICSYFLGLAVHLLHNDLLLTAIALSVGNVIGFLIHVSIAQMHIKFSIKLNFEYSLRYEFKKQLKSCVLYSIFNFSGLFLPYYAFSGFEAGVLTDFNLANQIYNIPISLYMTQMASISLVNYSANKQSNKKNQFKFYLEDQKKNNFVNLIFAFACSIFLLILPEIFTFFEIKLYFDINRVSLFAVVLFANLPSIGCNILFSKFVAANQILHKVYLYPIAYNLLLISSIAFMSQYFDALTVLYLLSIMPIFYWVIIDIQQKKMFGQKKYEYSLSKLTSIQFLFLFITFQVLFYHFK